MGSLSVDDIKRLQNLENQLNSNLKEKLYYFDELLWLLECLKNEKIQEDLNSKTLNLVTRILENSEYYIYSNTNILNQVLDSLKPLFKLTVTNCSFKIDNRAFYLVIENAIMVEVLEELVKTNQFFLHVDFYNRLIHRCQQQNLYKYQLQRCVVLFSSQFLLNPTDSNSEMVKYFLGSHIVFLENQRQSLKDLFTLFRISKMSPSENLKGVLDEISQLSKVGFMLLPRYLVEFGYIDFQNQESIIFWVKHLLKKHISQLSVGNFQQLMVKLVNLILKLNFPDLISRIFVIIYRSKGVLWQRLGLLNIIVKCLRFTNQLQLLNKILRSNCDLDGSWEAYKSNSINDCLNQWSVDDKILYEYANESIDSKFNDEFFKFIVKNLPNVLVSENVKSIPQIMQDKRIDREEHFKVNVNSFYQVEMYLDYLITNSDFLKIDLQSISSTNILEVVIGIVTKLYLSPENKVVFAEKLSKLLENNKCSVIQLLVRSSLPRKMEQDLFLNLNNSKSFIDILLLVNDTQEIRDQISQFIFRLQRENTHYLTYIEYLKVIRYLSPKNPQVIENIISTIIVFGNIMLKPIAYYLGYLSLECQIFRANYLYKCKTISQIDVIDNLLSRNIPVHTKDNNLLSLPTILLKVIVKMVFHNSLMFKTEIYNALKIAPIPILISVAFSCNSLFKISKDILSKHHFDNIFPMTAIDNYGKWCLFEKAPFKIKLKTQVNFRIGSFSHVTHLEIDSVSEIPYLRNKELQNLKHLEIHCKTTISTDLLEFVRKCKSIKSLSINGNGNAITDTIVKLNLQKSQYPNLTVIRGSTLYSRLTQFSRTILSALYPNIYADSMKYEITI
ncbi:hypothetical protein DLAC_11194 [Tieghemostelium lacteum]|uniref:Uncharacterized protein n=1 Tax=Tieghemostelium lacteum TaxID=361077 RepID=A0A151Z3E9_TIELA|nr:hypothetical protein DLAC_11194 [Tieghemostelium lacteum]|eukprot:KYQ88480.1 hypothetical protein DLAC_11194 [Tieghemostelium lacteum]